MKKTIKVITILMLVIMLITVLQSVVFAFDPTTISASAPASTSTDGLQSMAGKVLGIIQVATVVVAVVLIAWFGFKFVLGSANEKAEYQKSFIPLIIGVIVVFAATSIAKLIFSVAGSV